MLSAAEVASMRATQAQTLTTACTITHRALVSDNMGGQTETLTNVTAVCRCAASANMPDYQLVGARVNEAALWRITFAAETDVRKSDKITVGTRTFEVLGILGGATIETARVCICMEKA